MVELHGWVACVVHISLLVSFHFGQQYHVVLVGASGAKIPGRCIAKENLPLNIL